MKSYGALAGRYLKQQRRRTILTIVGIILSVALISALATMGQSMKDNMVEQTIYQDGAYHIGFGPATPEQYEKLSGNVLLDEVGAFRQGKLTEIRNTFQVQLIEATKTSFDLLPIHLQEGRLPQTPDEAVVEEWVLPNLAEQPKLGGTVELVKPNGDKHTYKIVGILKNQKYSHSEGKSKGYTFMADPGAKSDATLMAMATFKKGVDISQHLPEFQEMDKSAFFTNTRLLALKGESADKSLNTALLVIFGILIALVVLSTIAVIYNAFHIAVLERMRHFGLLRTIGATPSQIRKLVFREAGVLAAIGIPIGLVVGYGALWLVLWGMTSAGFRILSLDEFHLQLHAWIMIGSVVVGLLAVFLAAWLPARKASRVSPVDAVKGAGSIVRETYKRVRIPSLLNMMGVEGNMASKNIRRNRSKFRITAFSIVVSVMLFIVFHYFTQESLRMTVDNSEDSQVAFQIRQSLNRYDDNGNPIKMDLKDALSEDTIAQIEGMTGVKAVYRRYMMPNPAVILPSEKVDPNFTKLMGPIFEPRDYEGVPSQLVYTNLMLFDDARFKEAEKYLIAGTADPKKLAEDNAVLIVQNVKTMVKSKKKKIEMPIARLKVGDTLNLLMDYEFDPKVVRQVKVGGILSQSPFSPTLQENTLAAFGAKPTFVKLLKDVHPTFAPYGTTLMGVDVAVQDGASDEPIRQALKTIVAQMPNTQLIDIAQEQKESRQFNLQMQIFVYGFLIVIGLIGSLNIINTVQTNLLLRRRELGLLQAVGMTMGQLRRMASLEGVWFGVIGSFWGLLLGTGLSYLLYLQLNGMQGMPFRFPWLGAVISCGFALAVGLLSVQGPLRRMKKENLIEELREEV
ncbi:ABC transporter permease [Cohnella nanjingensis]|uniref:ABC transporter permease n=1 Tax=Cohnella nanjingensis TaxID=1387779 RepID=A0A7X0RML6_9BACL|nr:ABC transporter permease [Cohnella nanjingensis]MBB6670304.1 ABC transporter permease [Cohnella nanjingensis]